MPTTHRPLFLPIILALLSAPALAADVTVGPQGQIALDGKPTILLGVWQQPASLFQYHASLGMNSIIVPPADIGRRTPAEPYLKKAADSGLSVLMSVFDPALIAQPNIIGWDVGVIGGPRPSRDLADNVRRIRQADPKRLAMVNVMSYYMIKDKSRDATLKAELKQVDAVVSHVWPEMFEGQPRNLRLVGDFIDRIHELSADRPGRQISIWPDIDPHAWHTKGGEHLPAPTAEELRFQIWLALIHGADGICFFPISFDPFVYSQIPASNEKELLWNSRLIGRLAPVLTAEASPLKITVTAADEKAIIDQTTRRHDGADYLFVLNGQAAEQTVTLKLDGLGERFTLEDVVPVEPKPLAIANPGQYQEKLPGLALRIWRIRPLEMKQ